MARIVRKYGGSSLKQPDQIQRVAARIADMKWNGDEIVIVVSAMAATTDELLELARSLHPDPPRREMDMLLSVGERISCSLLAMALEAEGIGAVSYTGSQVGIITDTHHGEARIVEVRPARLLEALERDLVVVVAGFQGVSVEKEITTLGRGGSDATAVALAAAINADRCELMKDVDGLHTAHPDIVEDTELVELLDFDSALQLARGGTAALQSEAARIAKEHELPLAIGNSETDTVGTIITDRPLDCGEVVGIGRRDGLVRRQGTGIPPLSVHCDKVVENRGRWILWEHGDPGKRGPLSGLTIVTSGRLVDGLHQVVVESLGKADIPTFGMIERPDETWVCIETKKADEALRILHEACLRHGWINRHHRETTS